MSKGKLLIISQHFPPERSGNASRISDLSRFLGQDGFDVVVAAPFPCFPFGAFTKTNRLSATRREGDVTVVSLWAWQPGSPDPSFLERILYYTSFPVHCALWSLVHRRDFDVVITSSPPIFTHIVGLACTLFGKKKWVIDVRDLWIDAAAGLGFIKQGGVVETLARRFERYCLNSADLITVTTNRLGKGIAINPGIQEKVVVIPNGVDTDTFVPAATVKKDQIIYAGNVGHAQDLENVMLSLPCLDREVRVRLDIVGDGDILPDLREFARANNLEDHVVFSGVLDRREIPGRMAESRIGIAPLKRTRMLEYAAPTKVYEYMACGIPFIGCGRGEIEQIARESGAGVIADNDPESIKNAIASLISDPEEMARRGEAGRDYVVKFYDRRRIAERLASHLRRLT